MLDPGKQWARSWLEQRHGGIGPDSSLQLVANAGGSCSPPSPGAGSSREARLAHCRRALPRRAPGARAAQRVSTSRGCSTRCEPRCELHRSVLTRVRIQSSSMLTPPHHRVSTKPRAAVGLAERFSWLSLLGTSAEANTSWRRFLRAWQVTGAVKASQGKHASNVVASLPRLLARVATCPFTAGQSGGNR